MQKHFIDYELVTGDTGTVRVLAIDKIKMEKTVRANQWPLEDGPRSASLILYFALQRENKINSEDFDAFIADELLDWAQGEDPNPTNPTA